MTITGTEYQKLAMRTNDRKNVDRLSDKILQLHRFNPDIPGWDSRGGFDVGRIWVNDGNVSKMIYPKDLQIYLDNGFKKGRIRWKNE